MNDFTKEELDLLERNLKFKSPMYGSEIDLYSKIQNMITSYCNHKPIFELDTGKGIYNFYCMKCDKDLML